MATKIDGRSYQIDVDASIYHDGRSLLLTGWPEGYLDSALAEAPIYQIGTDTQLGEWRVVVDTVAGELVMTLSQDDIAALGEGTFVYELILELLDGSQPDLIGGTLRISRSHRRTSSTTSTTVDLVPTGATVTIEQIIGSGVSIIDGGDAASSGLGDIDGGSA